MTPRKGKMPETMYRASRCCRIIGNPTAYLILRSLGTGRKTPTALSRELGITLANVSFTLRHLRQVDLVRYETAGLRKEYWVKDRTLFTVLDALETWVETLRSRQF